MMPSASAASIPCPTQRAIQSALWYFEIFRYPLTADELYGYANCPGALPAEFTEELEKLIEKGLVFTFDGFYQAQDDPTWAPRRRDLNLRAEAFLPVARRMSRLIGAFPFIRAVFVSGSLSKHSMPPDGDIDYFMITEPGRLWLARTLLVFFKKLFLFNSHKYFCVNYFIDTEHLEIEEKNLFTATETVTLLPLYGREWYDRFCAANSWTKAYLPNVAMRPSHNTPLHQRGWLKSGAEWLLRGSLGAWLDTKAMDITVAYWRRKFRHFDDQTFDNALKSRRYVSKHHPLYFQKKVLAAYSERQGQ